MAEVAIWRETAATTTTVMGDSTRPRAIPQAMLTKKKETQGFHNLYAWFSYVSSISIGMGLRSPFRLGGRGSANTQSFLMG